jgi:hypothetical protein
MNIKTIADPMAGLAEFMRFGILFVVEHSLLFLTVRMIVNVSSGISDVEKPTCGFEKSSKLYVRRSWV